MAIGGYQIIDFKGIDLGETAVTLPGAYGKATAGKPVLAENLNIGRAVPACFMTVSPGDDLVELTALVGGVYSASVYITDEDAVTAAARELAEKEE